MPNMNDFAETRAQTIERIAAEAAGVELIDLQDGTQLASTPADRRVTIVPADEDHPLDHIRAADTRHTLDSFIAYVNRFAQPGTVVLVDVVTRSITATIDGHHHDDDLGNVAGWGSHKVTFRPVETAAATGLLGALNKWLPRAEFAEIVHQWFGHFTAPADAVLYALAEQLNVTTEIEYAQGERRDNGARTLKFVEKATATAGGAGEVEVPAEVEFTVDPYIDSCSIDIAAKVRVRVRDGDAAIRLDYPNLDESYRYVFDDYVTRLNEGPVALHDIVPVEFGPAK